METNVGVISCLPLFCFWIGIKRNRNSSNNETLFCGTFAFSPYMNICPVWLLAENNLFGLSTLGVGIILHP